VPGNFINMISGMFSPFIKLLTVCREELLKVSPVGARYEHTIFGNAMLERDARHGVSD